MTLGLIMGYYNNSLTDAANKVCTITTPFGNYEYNHLPMRVFTAPAIFQEQTMALMDDLDFVRDYFDNFLIIKAGSFRGALRQGPEYYEATPVGWSQMQY